MERRYEQRAAFGTRRHEKGTFSTGISHETGVPHMSPVGLEHEMYVAIMAEVRDITARIQRSAEA